MTDLDAPRPARRSWWLEEALALPGSRARDATLTETRPPTGDPRGGYTGRWTAGFSRSSSHPWNRPDRTRHLLRRPSGRNGGSERAVRRCRPAARRYGAPAGETVEMAARSIDEVGRGARPGRRRLVRPVRRSRGRPTPRTTPPSARRWPRRRTVSRTSIARVRERAARRGDSPPSERVPVTPRDRRPRPARARPSERDLDAASDLRGHPVTRFDSRGRRPRRRRRRASQARDRRLNACSRPREFRVVFVRALSSYGRPHRSMGGCAVPVARACKTCGPSPTTCARARRTEAFGGSMFASPGGATRHAATVSTTRHLGSCGDFRAGFPRSTVSAGGLLGRPIDVAGLICRSSSRSRAGPQYGVLLTERAGPATSGKISPSALGADDGRRPCRSRR